DFSKRNTEQANKNFISRGQLTCAYAAGRPNAASGGLCPSAAFTCANGQTFSVKDFRENKSTFDKGNCVIPDAYKSCFEYNNGFVTSNEIGLNSSEIGAYYKVSN